MSDQPAAGGTGQGSEAADGGPGGAGDNPAGGVGKTNSDSGGGGGAVGRVRINAGSSSVQGLVSPSQATGAFTVGPLLLASQ